MTRDDLPNSLGRHWWPVQMGWESKYNFLHYVPIACTTKFKLLFCLTRFEVAFGKQFDPHYTISLAFRCRPVVFLKLLSFVEALGDMEPPDYFVAEPVTLHDGLKFQPSGRFLFCRFGLFNQRAKLPG